MKRLTCLLVMAEMMALMGSSGRAASLTPGDSTRSVLSGGLVRTYLVHVPTGYVAGQPTPVVLALHPLFNDGADMATYTNLSVKADSAGFIAVYPDGTSFFGMTHWNSGCIPGDTVDDVGFISALLDDLATVASVDPKRVFATGYSDGAAMSFRLAAQLSNRIAAIAAVGDNMGTYVKINATRPVSILHMLGTDDNEVSPPWGTGGSGYSFLSVPETFRAWAAVDGYSLFPSAVYEFPSTTADSTRAWRWTYGPGQQGSEYVYYEIVGGGHTWPGSPVWFTMELLGFGVTSQDISANDEIWAFFQRHPMP